MTTKKVSKTIFFKEKLRLTGWKVFRNKATAFMSLIEYKEGIEKIKTTRRPIKKIFKYPTKLRVG